VDINKLTQRIDGIRIECKDLSANCSVESSIGARIFNSNINRAIADPIQFFGTMDGAVFKVYFDRDYRYHKYRLATSRMPFAWVSSTPNSDGMHDVFFFNMGNTMHFSLYRWTLYLTIRMIYLTRNITINLPRLNSMLKLCTDGSNRHFDAKYVNYYRQMHMNQNLTPASIMEQRRS
jgi:hypothetical protein